MTTDHELIKTFPGTSEDTIQRMTNSWHTIPKRMTPQVTRSLNCDLLLPLLSSDVGCNGRIFMTEILLH